ncbi:MAG: ABC transporter permease [Tetrasphaera sp.]|jgi:ABC-2 type transport system permease protein|nr:ABC transporter permease [Tetrasphaera sp.]
MTAVIDPTTSPVTHDSATVAPISGIPFARLVRVELRKMVDTRAGRWMLIVMSGISALMVAALVLWGNSDKVTLGDYVGLTSFPLMVLLPIVGIMAATAEWSQRTGLVTFTLEPRRARVLLAKILAGVALGLVVVAASFAAGALGHLVATTVRGAHGDWSMPGQVVLGFVVAMTMFVVQGLAFGFAFLNTPLAIVASILLPTVWSIVGALPKMRTAATWLDLNRSMEPLMSGSMTASAWAHLGTASVVWIGIPLAVGGWRVLTREVK